MEKGKPLNHVNLVSLVVWACSFAQIPYKNSSCLKISTFLQGILCSLGGIEDTGPGILTFWNFKISAFENCTSFKKIRDSLKRVIRDSWSPTSLTNFVQSNRTGSYVMCGWLIIDHRCFCLHNSPNSCPPHFLLVQITALMFCP